MFRTLFYTILFLCLTSPLGLMAAELRLAAKDSNISLKKEATDEEDVKEEKDVKFRVIDAGPGFGPRWLSENSLGFAYLEYDVRKKFPFNNLVFTKIRYDGDMGGLNDIFKLPVGNSVMESSVHFVYDSRYRQLGFMISNAADRFGSAHGLQVGVHHLGVDKSRIYLESPYYLNTGYEEVSGASMAPDNRGFVVSFSGDIYYIPFGDAGARDTPQISEIYQESYLPSFDDSTIGAELIREGKNTRYPVYFSKSELLFYEEGDLLLYNIDTKATNLVASVGKNVRGLSVSNNTKQIAILKGDEIIRYDIAGNVLDRLETGIFKARNLAWSPDERYFAFDDIEKVYIVELDAEATPQPKGRPEKPKRVAEVMPQVTLSCGSADRIMGIRKDLEAEINNLRSDLGQSRLVGLRKVSAQLRQLANCQSTIVRGGSTPVAEDSVPTIDQPRVTESTTREDKFQVLDDEGASRSTPEDEPKSEGFKVKKPSRTFNKFRDSPDMF